MNDLKDRTISYLRLPILHPKLRGLRKDVSAFSDFYRFLQGPPEFLILDPGIHADGATHRTPKVIVDQCLRINRSTQR